MKDWLALSLLSFKTDLFYEEFKDCVLKSNVVVIVYDILPQQLYKDIKHLS